MQAETIFGEKLGSEIFTYQNSSRVCGVSVLSIFDGGDKIFGNQFVLEGWCYANTLSALPRDDGFAVMLWDKKNKQKVWCHVSTDLFDTLINKHELLNKKKGR